MESRQKRLAYELISAQVQVGEITSVLAKSHRALEEGAKTESHVQLILGNYSAASARSSLEALKEAKKKTIESQPDAARAANV